MRRTMADRLQSSPYAGSRSNATRLTEG